MDDTRLKQQRAHRSNQKLVPNPEKQWLFNANQYNIPIHIDIINFTFGLGTNFLVL